MDWEIIEMVEGRRNPRYPDARFLVTHLATDSVAGWYATFDAAEGRVRFLNRLNPGWGLVGSRKWNDIIDGVVEGRRTLWEKLAKL